MACLLEDADDDDDAVDELLLLQPAIAPPSSKELAARPVNNKEWSICHENPNESERRNRTGPVRLLCGETTNLGVAVFGSPTAAGRIDLIEDRPRNRASALASAECRT